MRRALLWLLVLFLVWEGWVYLYSRSRSEKLEEAGMTAIPDVFRRAFDERDP